MSASNHNNGRKPDEAAFLAAIIDSAEDAIISKTLEGIITTWNPSAERIFGYTAEEAIGNSILMLIPPDRHHEEPNIISRIRQGQRIQHYETVRRRKDGTLIDISLTVSPIRNADGKIIGASKITRDITEQKRSERKLRENEERLRVTLASIGDAVIATDISGRVTFMNPVAESLTGWSMADAAGLALETVFPIFNERTRKPVDSPVVKVLREGLIVGLANHTALRNKQGKEIPIADSAAPIRDARGELMGVVLVFRDVTEAHDADLTRRRLAAVIESSDDAIFTKDLDGVITSWNRGAERLFGYLAEEIIGKHISILFPPDRMAEETLILERLKRGEKIEHYETIRVRKDGTPVNVSLSISPIKDAEGNIIGISKIVRDITQRKRAEQALKQAQRELEQHALLLEKRVAERTAQLEETNRSLESLSYSIAHDLRAPLRAMRGMAQLLLEDYAQKLDDTGKGYAQRIVDSAGKMSVLIEDLLTYGRLSRVELPLSSVDTEELAERVIEQLKDEIAARKGRVEIIKPLPPVVANPTTLEQIMANLISNGLKFVAPGVVPRVTISAERKGEVTRLNFKDNGIGIAPEYHQKIFHMFERLEGVQKYPGTGIGLAIVQKGVERMNGRVGVDSEPGKGSTFWIELP